jgi:hypothetical protein
VTKHAEIRAMHRNIKIEEVISNILSPEKLVFIKEQEKEKYECYFEYSKDFCHKYILVTNGKVIRVTIISINRGWQKAIGK